jgi:GNAT superfamily N-acetyltransferase
VTAAAQLRPLRDGEVPTGATMLAEAFADDPLPRLLSPDPRHRDSRLRWYLTAVARYGLAFGEVWAAVSLVGDLDGVAIWWAPEFVYPSAARAAYAGFLEGEAVLGVDVWEQLMAIGWLVGDVHEQAISEPHWYLNILGVRPERQRQGIGGQLLSHMLERLDRERVPAYLDTGRPENVPYYQHFGFVLAARGQDDVTGLTVYGLRRDPA